MCVAVGEYLLPDPYRFYPQVLKGVLHIVVGGVFDAFENDAPDKFLKLFELKKTSANSHAIHSHLMTFVARIFSVDEGQPILLRHRIKPHFF